MGVTDTVVDLNVVVVNFKLGCFGFECNAISFTRMARPRAEIWAPQWNTLAYHGADLITVIKSFIVQVPVPYSQHFTLFVCYEWAQ